VVSELTTDEVAESLGLDGSYRGWLDELSALAEAGAPACLPGSEEAALLLRRTGCSAAVVSDAVATLFSPESDPARAWLLERCHRRIVATMGDAAAPRGTWPQLPRRLGVAGECFYLHVFLATLAATRAWHAAHGVPDDVSWATLADLGRHTELHHIETGRSGIDEPWWMTLHLRAVLFEIGRLQYAPYRLGEGPEQPRPWLSRADALARGEGFAPGDDALAVHIPAGSPLEPARCEESLRLARCFFDSRFPVSARRVATCCSWLLDDQLAGMLPAGSNIVAFGRSFELVEGWGDADANVVRFVFQVRAAAAGGELDPRVLERLPGRTTLERAIVNHLRSGGHFRWRTGWRDLPEGR
jgi:hypothetical protein